MTDRTLTILGTIASALGLVISIITVIFTDYKVASLISLFVVELIVILIWAYYSKQKNRVMFPYDYEVGIDAARYVFETENRMTYESMTAVKVTKPHLSDIPVRLVWSGRGTITLDTPLLNRTLEYKFDGITGVIDFSYPISPNHKLGEMAVIYFKLILEDTANQNIPELYARIKKPTKLVVLEVVLKYKQDCLAADFGYRQMDGEPSSFLPYQRLGELPFDERSKSYRMVISHPLQNYKYQLKWVK